MVHRQLVTRTTLLALSLLSACAAADPPSVPGPDARPLAGTSGDILVGHFALRENDANLAAQDFLAALKADPQDTELEQQAFAASVMAGRPEAVALAHEIPANPTATLVLGNADIKAGNWRAAEAQFATLPTQGATQVLQPLLRAWAEQGAGATDQALDTLRPFIEGTRYRGVFALHAAMINDQSGRTAEASRLYRLAMVEYGALNLRLGTIAGSWQARGGQEAEARATIRATVQASPTLAIAEPALQQAAAATKVATAKDGVAEAYLAMAATMQQQDANDFALLLLHMALDLRPDFTSARLLAAEIQSVSGQVATASATLADVPPSDPLIAVVQLRLAQYAEREGQTAQAQRLFEQLATQYPRRPEPLALLAEMQRSEGHFAEAAETYTGAIQRLQQPAPSDWALFYERGHGVRPGP